MEFAQRVFITDPYAVFAQINMPLFSALMLQMSNLDLC